MSARQQNRDRLNALIDANMAKDSSANWIEKMTQTGVPCGEINSIDQVFESPAVQHLEMVWPGNSHESGETKYLAQPITMSRSKSGLRTPPPKRGQHSDEILDTLGYSPGEIEGLRAKGVI